MRYMGLDVGDERIGVALSDSRGWLARPLEVITRSPGAASYLRIAALVAEHQVGCIVVGWPLLPDGSEGRQVRSTAAYLEGLYAHVQLPVVRWDERSSTREAVAIMVETGKSRRRARRTSDAVAAAVILQAYLDEQSK